MNGLKNNSIKSDDLKLEGYEVVKQIQYSDLNGFVVSQVTKFNLYTFSFFAGIFILGAIAGCLVSVAQTVYELSFGRIMGQLGLTFCISCLFMLLFVVPLHELLHAVGYQMVGAKHIKFGVLWKQLAFYCTAINFVANYKQFRLIALLPNIVINIILLIILYFSIMFSSGIFWSMVITWLLFLHIGGGLGDLMLLAFMKKFKKEDVVTWDDVDAKTMYVLIKK